jgi:hypothetical protein
MIYFHTLEYAHTRTYAQERGTNYRHGYIGKYSCNSNSCHNCLYRCTCTLVYRLIVQKCCWSLWEGSHGNIRIDLHWTRTTHTGRCAARSAHMYTHRNIEIQVLHGSIAHFQFFRGSIAHFQFFRGSIAHFQFFRRNSLSYTVLQPRFPTLTVSNSALTQNSALGCAKIHAEPKGRFGHTSWSNALEWLVRRVLETHWTVMRLFPRELLQSAIPQELLQSAPGSMPIILVLDYLR